MNITGAWSKTSDTDCSSKYPARITFRPNGLYEAAAAAGAMVHPVWDVGTFEKKDGVLRISTANDAVISYGLQASDGVLTLTDPEGCTVSYQRD